MINCMAHSMLTIREACSFAYKRIDLLRHVGSGPHTWTRAGFRLEKCHRKARPAGLDRPKISLRWKQGMRTLPLYGFPYTKLPHLQCPTDDLLGHGNRTANAWRGCTNRQRKRSAATNEWRGKDLRGISAILRSYQLCLSHQAVTQPS